MFYGYTKSQTKISKLAIEAARIQRRSCSTISGAEEIKELQTPDRKQRQHGYRKLVDRINLGFDMMNPDYEDFTF